MKKLSNEEKLERIESFAYMTTCVKGPVKLKEPDVIFATFGRSRECPNHRSACQNLGSIPPTFEKCQGTCRYLVLPQYTV